MGQHVDGGSSLGGAERRRCGVHLDLKGAPPTAERLVALPRLFAAAGYDLVLVEWEDAFPWTVDRRFRSETAYTAEQVRAFCAAATQAGVEVVPLIQCLGHMETPLSVPEYAGLREVADQADGLNPLAAGARELVERMMDDVLAVLPEVRYFHLGGDEAWTFGQHPDTRRFIEQHGAAELYLRHVGPLIERLGGRGIRPILWHDMMRQWPEEQLRELGRRADLMVWAYHGDPANAGSHCNLELVRRFADCGIRMWGATAYKGADGASADVPDVSRRASNAGRWMELAKSVPLVGMVATAWSRYSTHDPQCELIETTWDALFAIGGVLNGQAPAAPAAVESRLRELGEWDRFQAAYSAARVLSDQRQMAWTNIRRLYELQAMAACDPRRRGRSSDRRTIEQVRRQLGEARRAGEGLRQAVDGRVPGIWMERYLFERLEPIERNLRQVEANWSPVNPTR